MLSYNSMSLRLNEGEKKKGLNGSILDCQAVYGKFYKAISSPARVGATMEYCVYHKRSCIAIPVKFGHWWEAIYRKQRLNTKTGWIPNLSSWHTWSRTLPLAGHLQAHSQGYQERLIEKMKDYGTIFF